jgi:hypothetical protein
MWDMMCTVLGSVAVKKVEVTRKTWPCPMMQMDVLAQTAPLPADDAWLFLAQIGRAMYEGLDLALYGEMTSRLHIGWYIPAARG